MLGVTVLKNMKMLMHFITAQLLGFLLLLGICYAEDSSTRSFQLPKRGSIELTVPRSWKDQVRQPPDNLPPTFVFTPANGISFQILVTPMWAIRPGVVMPEREDIRRSVTKAAEHAKSQSVEKVIPIVEIKGDSGNGYYFRATDRSPKPDEYKYMTQGILRIGELAATVTILTNDGGEEVVAAALQMLKSARHVYRKAP